MLLLLNVRLVVDCISRVTYYFLLLIHVKHVDICRTVLIIISKGALKDPH